MEYNNHCESKDFEILKKLKLKSKSMEAMTNQNR